MSCETAQREHFCSLSVSTAKAEVRCHARPTVTRDTRARHKYFGRVFRGNEIENELVDSLGECRRKIATLCNLNQNGKNNFPFSTSTKRQQTSGTSTCRVSTKKARGYN